jgi:hypothetical protein
MNGLRASGKYNPALTMKKLGKNPVESMLVITPDNRLEPGKEAIDKGVQR